MKQTKIKQSQKGFTLIEVLLVIVLIGILISIGLVTFNAEARFIDARNDIRKTHIQTLESAITQYRLQDEEGNYPTGLSRNYQEICDPEATVCTGFFDLKPFLVPTYLQAIPQDPNDADTTGGTGYSVAVDEATNTVSVRALQAEGGETIAINDPLPAEPTTVSNTPLAATVPVNPIVTNGLVLHLDAGNTASYPGTGNTWFDLSGNGNNLYWSSPAPIFSSYNNVPVISTITTYLSLRSVRSTTYNNMRINANSYTVFSFFRPNQTTNGKILISFGPANSICGGQNIHPIAINNGKFVGGSCGGLGTWGVNSGASVTNDRFWNVGTTYDGVTERVYVNSVLDKTSSSFTNNTPASSLNAISLGWIRDDGAAYSMDANIGNILIYNRALTPAEIQQNFNATRGRFGL